MKTDLKNHTPPPTKLKTPRSEASAFAYGAPDGKGCRKSDMVQLETELTELRSEVYVLRQKLARERINFTLELARHRMYTEAYHAVLKRLDEVKNKSPINESVDTYVKLQEEICNYFRYQEGWEAIPLEDLRTHYWSLADGQRELVYSLDPGAWDSQDGTYYSGEVVRGPNGVYRGPELTLVVIDTGSDVGKLATIFSNDKEIPPTE